MGSGWKGRGVREREPRRTGGIRHEEGREEGEKKPEEDTCGAVHSSHYETPHGHDRSLDAETIRPFGAINGTRHNAVCERGVRGDQHVGKKRMTTWKGRKKTQKKKRRRRRKEKG